MKNNGQYKPYRSRDLLDTNSISQYFKEIGHYHKLSSEEEAQCAREYRNGDEKALEKLVLSNLRFVVTIAKKYQYLGLSLSDLISEGNIGLMRAAKKFDETRKLRFITCAVWWIKQAILQYLSEHGRIVRIPQDWTGRLFKIRKAQNDLSQELGRIPTNTEIYEEVEMDFEDVDIMLPRCQPHISLESGLGDQDDLMLINMLPDENTPDPIESLNDNDIKRRIVDMLDSIQDRDARILRYYFGFDNSDPLTLEEIGGIFGVTRERIRQIKEQALKNLCAANSADRVLLT